MTASKEQSPSWSPAKCICKSWCAWQALQIQRFVKCFIFMMQGQINDKEIWKAQTDVYKGQGKDCTANQNDPTMWTAMVTRFSWAIWIQRSEVSCVIQTGDTPLAPWFKTVPQAVPADSARGRYYRQHVNGYFINQVIISIHFQSSQLWSTLLWIFVKSDACPWETQLHGCD